MRGGLIVHRFGPFELDTANRCLFRDGTRIRLSGAPLAILTSLVSNAGVAVPKEQLVTAGWGSQSVSDNSLEQAIYRLRRVLGNRLGTLEYIETVKQTGYRLGVPVEQAERDRPRDPLDAQLERFVAAVESGLQLDTLDRGQIAQTRARLADRLHQMPDDGRAHALMAMACGLAYEASVLDEYPDTATLACGRGHARTSCELMPGAGQSWSALAFVLGLGGDTSRAIGAATKALEIEPGNWRHALLLARVGWGEVRVQAARQVLAVCPSLALAHWLRTTVFIARGAFATALDELREGCAAQDAQTPGCPFTAVGLHLLHGLVLSAHGRLDDAAAALLRESPSETSGQIYARECAANTWYALGAVRRRQGRHDEATRAFERALEIAPFHACAHAALHGEVLASATPMDRAFARAIVLARGNRHRDAATELTAELSQQPAGAAAWILPVEPSLHPAGHAEHWTKAMARIRLRAT